MRIFGSAKKGVDYILRKGAYAIIFHKDDFTKVALIRAHGDQYFLPGGGIETDETDEQCLCRELLEETGCAISNLCYFAHAQRYFLSTMPVTRPMISDGYFYTARLGRQVETPIERDHFLEWVDVRDCARLMYHEHQAWATQEAYARLKRGAWGSIAD